MTWELRGYERALDGFEAVLGEIRPASWTARTPCVTWTAYDVAGHMIGGQLLIKALATGARSPDLHTEPGRFCRPDPVVSWEKARRDCTASLTEEGLARLVPVGPLGELPLHDFLGGYILELLVHTWDLAIATGQEVTLPSDLVHHAFGSAQVIAPTLRLAGHYGPPLPPPPKASELTRLLAFLGRTDTSPTHH
jgi:uncharacterized protein (TIGR03086 family)